MNWTGHFQNGGALKDTSKVPLRDFLTIVNEQFFILDLDHESTLSQIKDKGIEFSNSYIFTT